MIQFLIVLAFVSVFTYNCTSSSSCNSIHVELKRGIYKFECWGAQGGTGCANGNWPYHGGKGAYVSGHINILENTTLFLFIGGKGSNPTCLKNSVAAGGWNGGGNGGKDTRDDDSSGSGGGASDIRLINGAPNNITSLISRIMVAAGGSGSTAGSYGAPGGTLNGYYKTYNAVLDVKESTNTTQTKGNQFGRGANGDSHEYTPSSGAGGGYYGGVAKSGIETPTYKAVSESGSSYISGHQSCDSVSSSGAHTGSQYHHSGLSFFNTSMISGIGIQPHPTSNNTMQGNTGNGAIRITFISDYVVNTEHIHVYLYIKPILYGLLLLPLF